LLAIERRSADEALLVSLLANHGEAREARRGAAAPSWLARHAAAWWTGAARRDLLVVLAVTLCIFVLADLTDLNERFTRWVSDFHDDLIDPEELPIAVALTGVLAVWFFVRRARENLARARQSTALADAARQELALANARLHDAIESIPEGFVLFDAEDRVVLWNRRYEEIYGIAPGAMMRGRSFEEMIRAGAARGNYRLPPGRPVEAWIAERLAQHAATGSESEQQLADGRWVLSHERRTAEGGSVGIRIDITELKRREAEMRLALDRAEAANRAKSAFLANMSHELRTPLTAVLGFSEIIASETMGPIGQPAYKECAADIHSAGQHLLQLVSDVLDLARIEADRLELHLEPVDAAGMAQELSHMMRAEAARAGVLLQLAPADGVPLVQADLVRLRQALLNLLGNALKFTRPGGSVTVATTFDAAAGRVLLAVRDTGIGIAARDIATALEPFGQVDSALSRRYEGAGLGLPLARRFVEAMGGRLILESEPGRGTSVTLDLPAIGAPPP
jgi:PAS domain S-box-containing protein